MKQIDIKSLYSDYVQTLETYIMFRIKQDMMRLKPELEAKNRAPINLSIGAPVNNPPTFVINAMKKALEIEGIHSYSTPKGEPFLLEAIAKRMENRFGVKLDTSTEIFSLVGSKEGLANMFRAFVNPTMNEKDQDIILIPDPGYASYHTQLKVIGAKGYPIALSQENNFMPKMEDVIEQLKNDGFNPNKIKALVINYPNNPLGVSATREYLKEIVDFCRKNNIVLISDAAYADVYFESDQKPASILEFEGAKDIAIEFHSLSKPYAMTGWRIGFACGNKELVDILGRLKSTVDTGIFKAIQKASSEILTAKEGDDYIIKSNKLYKRKQDIFIEGIKELGWPMDEVHIPNSTFYLWLPIPKRYKSSEEFTTALLEKSGIVIVPGSGFGKYGEGFVRISLVSSDDNLREVISRMKKDGFNY